MTKNTYQCKECACEAKIEYDYEDIGQEPLYCTFCGTPYIEEELDEMEYPNDDRVDDEW